LRSKVTHKQNVRQSSVDLRLYIRLYTRAATRGTRAVAMHNARPPKQT
jgi:hypothetical protein